jgi:hypothetical protein
MEKNKTKYWLTVAMLGVWGLVAYRFYQRASPNNGVQTPTALPKMSGTAAEKDSFSLLLTYGNPFASSDAPKRTTENNSNAPSKGTAVRTPPEVKPEPPMVAFPAIGYKGNVKLKSGRMAAILSIGGSISNIGVGEKLEEVTLLEIYEDSIRVRFQKAEKIILKARQ